MLCVSVAGVLSACANPLGGQSSQSAVGSSYHPGLPASASADHLAIVSGNGQAATVVLTPQVQCLDSHNNPVAGVVLSFLVTLGGGSVSPATVTTDAAGMAQVNDWSSSRG
jgi:hypothetical protein